PGEALVRYWRLLFHARVHLALEGRVAEGKLSATGVRQRIHRIGQAEFDEIRAVLRQEKYLLDPHDPVSVYVEFAALYLELRHFAPHLLAHYFPTVPHPGPVDRVLAEDLDGESLAADTRPEGAPDPADHGDLDDDTDAVAESSDSVPAPAEPSE